MGDFNIHMDNLDNPEAAQFANLLNDCNCIQLVNQSTHMAGHILDLIIIKCSYKFLDPKDVSIGSFISDHAAVHFCCRLEESSHKKCDKKFRKLRSVDIPSFLDDIETALNQKVFWDKADANDLADCYNATIKCTLDKHAPMKTVRVPEREPVPWYTGGLRQQKQHVRRAERRWRKSGLPVDSKEFTKQRNIFTDMASVVKKDHIKQKIKDCDGDQKLLFRLVNELLGRSKSKRLPTIYDSEADLANMFSDFFHEKISNIRNVLSNFSASGTAHETSHPPSSTWLAFQLVSSVEVSKIIKSSPCKSCALDPVPTWMVKAAPERFADIIAKIINSSLATGIVPDIFKRAHVTPLLKKTTLDPDSLDNYRPISQLQIVSKVLEKVVGNFLCEYLKGNDLFENLQSAYQPGHSVETALVKVTNDILLALDKKQMVLLVLLDLSAAFDTVDHDLLLMRMLHRFGISGNVLKWFHSYLTLRSQVVTLWDSSSKQCYIECGVPQGSVLGPILFTMYTSPLGDIARRVGLSYHLYADDTQLYVAFKPGITDQVCCRQIQDCLAAMQDWMSGNFLKLNNDKTDVILIGSRHQHSVFEMEHISLNGQNLSLLESVCDLGVILDNRLNMNDHITSACKSANYHLRNIARIRRFLSESDAVKVIHALVSSRIDYCNAVLAGLPNSYLSPPKSTEQCRPCSSSCEEECSHHPNTKTIPLASSQEED
ncbi:uncharacterized protein [Diadema antillarum]|uniref:uncharacterized protein n=1 Tax=Diadema antillarum TaxID=105358 RepID=UPI003A8A197C